VRRNRRGPRSVRPADRRACITTLRSPQIRNPAVEGALKGHCRFRYWMSAARMKLPKPGCACERLVVCRSPLPAEGRARERRQLIAAAEQQLDGIVAATKRLWRPRKSRRWIDSRRGGRGRLESGEALFRGEHPRKFAVSRVAHTRSPRLRRLGMMRLPRTAWRGTNVAPSPLCCSLRSGGNHPGGSPCVMRDPARAGRAGSGRPVSRIRAGGADVGEGVAG
jgi:hypothetical protein